MDKVSRNAANMAWRHERRVKQLAALAELKGLVEKSGDNALKEAYTKVASLFSSNEVQHNAPKDWLKTIFGAEPKPGKVVNVARFMYSSKNNNAMHEGETFNEYVARLAQLKDDLVYKHDFAAIVAKLKSQAKDSGHVIMAYKTMLCVEFVQ